MQVLPTVDEEDEKDVSHERDSQDTTIDGGDDASDHGRFATSRTLGTQYRHWIGATLVVAVFLALWTLARMIPPPTSLREYVLTADGKSFPSGQLTWSQKFTPLPCGKTPSEAKARGCHFDLIATAWLPPKCIDFELVDEFVSRYKWKYYRSPNGTEQYPDDADTLGSQTSLIWMTHRWHNAHCLYMWKKLNRALVQGRMTDGETIQMAHTDHCIMTLLDSTDPDEIGSLIEIIYPPC
ncbi:hypothetical protein QBC47DRAFT_300509 [Echria macrotheca]|uniref:Uncharacterized protein n=1 Tax=Echria macrotheca TaxID=438768 RepID=A0AAJ0F9I3_9PEZI|nr:hypothetical protein QBC47DRAFT_300509 [Echria macrotheca]